MAASDHAQPISRREDALAIVRRLADAGHIAYFAGGCVRDMLLGLSPKDYDVATDATPDTLRRLFPRSQGVGQAFGVVLVREGKSVIEVATFRADGTYSDGRRPDDVRFATPAEDARRRDFTVNGIFFDPVADRVIDLVGGVADLQARTLRAIGDPAERFSEDYLRLLRAVRFAARFDFAMEPATADAIRINADRLPRIAPERIADEIHAMFVAPSRIVALRLLDELRLTPVLLRHVVDVSLPLSNKHELFAATCAGEAASFSLCLATLTLEAQLANGRPLLELLSRPAFSASTRALRQTFRLSNEDTAAIEATLDLAPLLQPAEPRVAMLKRFLARPFSSDARRLLRGLAATNHHLDRIQWLEHAFDGFKSDTIAPPPLVTGDDLQAAGHRPGPAFKRALDEAYDAQLEERATTAAEAMAVAEAVLRDLTPSR